MNNSDSARAVEQLEQHVVAIVANADGAKRSVEEDVLLARLAAELLRQTVVWCCMYKRTPRQEPLASIATDAEAPICRITLKGLVAQIKKKMAGATASGVDFDPIIGALTQAEITPQLVKEAPVRSRPAKAALSTVPSLIVRRPKAISTALKKPQDTRIILTEGGKLDGIHAKRQHQVVAINSR